jgi:hypothetical protein
MSLLLNQPYMLVLYFLKNSVLSNNYGVQLKINNEK